MGFLDNMLKPVKSAGKWVVHAAEDTFHFGKQTINNVVNLSEKAVSGGVKSVGSAGKSLLNFADNQTSKVENVLTNPTLAIAAGCIVVAIILMR